MANEFKVRKGLIVQGSGSIILDIQGSQGELFSVTDSLSGSLFSVNDISGIPIMEVFSDNTIKMGTFNQEAIIVSGSRTGMGIATPQAKLHISGANNDSLFRIQSPASASIMFVSGSGLVGIGTLTPTQKISVDNGNVGFTSGFGISWDSDTEWVKRAAASDQLQFATQNTVRLNIGSTQGQLVAIGLGATAASAQFQVRGGGATAATTAMRIEDSGGNARLTILDDGTSAFNTSHLYVSSSGLVGVGTALPTAKLHISGASTDSLLRVGSPTQANALFVSGSGRVGIGTGTPRAALHVSAGDISLDGTRYLDWANGDNRIIGGSAGGFSLQFHTYTGTALTEKMRISGSGEVGIGVTTMTARLHVSGASNAGLFKIDSPAVNNIIYVSGSGNVGIGTGTPTNTLQVVGGITATSITASIISASSGITGSLFGTSSWAVNALTASFVTTLNQNVLVTGSLTIGATSLGANENTLVLGPSPAGGTGEGGQILLQSPGGIYTSASMWDNYQNLTRLLRGTNAGSDAVVSAFNMHTKQMQLPAYNSTTAFVGTVAGVLGFDSSGNILTTTTSGASPAFPFTGSAQITGSLGVTGSISSTGTITSTANNQMYFRGGDDAEFWDINIANTVGIYGQQNAGVASIKLGSGGGTVSGQSSSIGINTTSPTATLHVSGASADSLLRVGSPTLATTLFVTGSGRVGVGTSTPSQLFEVVRSSTTKIVAGDDVGIQTATASDWIHLSSDPANTKYLRIDATQISNGPQQSVVPGTFNYVAGPGTDDAVLGLPNYWMEIKLDGNIVLIPCYVPQ